jgi:hypothetical protein
VRGPATRSPLPTAYPQVFPGSSPSREDTRLPGVHTHPHFGSTFALLRVTLGQMGVVSDRQGTD